MTPSRCILCAGHSRHAGVDWLRRCRDCGHLWSDLSPDFSDPTAGQSLDRRRLHAASFGLRERNLGAVLDALVSVHNPRGATLLDVGSGDGLGQALARRRGYVTSGIEPDRAVADDANRRGFPTVAGLFPDALPADQSADVILFNHTIEHIPAPIDVLRAAATRLSPSGLVVIHSPTADGALHRLALRIARLRNDAPLSRMWWRGFPSPLLHRFTHAGLRRLNDLAGLDVIADGRTSIVERRGLWGRIGADRRLGIAGQAALWTGLQGALPIVSAGRPDYVFTIARPKTVRSNR